jgi:hypothetical protein
MSNRAIKDAIKQLSGTFNKDFIAFIECTVDSVDTDAQTCDCTAISGQAETAIPNVKLSAEANNGILITPTVGSTVIVGLSERAGAFVIMYEDLDVYQIAINTTAFLMNDGLIQFNDGSFDGLVKVVELTEKLNNIENLVNDLILKFNTHTHVLTLSAGTGTAAPTTTTETDTLTPTNQSEIENTAITHGE